MLDAVRMEVAKVTKDTNDKKDMDKNYNEMSRAELMERAGIIDKSLSRGDLIILAIEADNDRYES